MTRTQVLAARLAQSPRCTVRELVADIAEARECRFLAASGTITPSQRRSFQHDAACLLRTACDVTAYLLTLAGRGVHHWT